MEKFVVITTEDVHIGWIAYKEDYRGYIQYRFGKEHGLFVRDWSKMRFLRTDSDRNPGLKVVGKVGAEEGLVYVHNEGPSKEQGSGIIIPDQGTETPAQPTGPLVGESGTAINQGDT